MRFLEPLMTRPSTFPTRLLTASLALMAAGCWGRDIEYKSDGTVDTGPTEIVACGDEPDEITGWTLQGVAIDLETETRAAAADGLCATAIDPSPVLAGQPPIDLASAQICDDGAFTIYNLGAAPAVGMFVLIDDCAPGEGDTAATEQDDVLQSANGVSSDDIAGLGAGDVYVMDSATGKGDLVYLTRTFQLTLEAEFINPAGSIDETGFLGGRLLDASLAPVTGATIDCSGCGSLTASYPDNDDSDGLFMTGGTANAASMAEADGRFYLPGASVDTYNIDDGGTHTWEGTLLGGLAGYAVFSNFIATN
jgi:hypothetical protein